MFPRSSFSADLVFSKIFLLVFFPIDKQGKGSFENYIIAQLISNSQIGSNRLHIWISNPVPIDSLHNHLVTNAIFRVDNTFSFFFLFHLFFFFF